MARIESVGGCALKYETCAEYKSEAACHKTLGNTGGTDDCLWDSTNEECTENGGGGGGGEGPIPCSELVLDTFTNDSCSAVNSKCKANAGSTACINIPCTDYSTDITTAD